MSKGGNSRLTNYPYAHGCGPDSKRRLDKYWKYENVDSSTAHYAKVIVNKIFDGMRETIDKEGRNIYHVRPEAIIVQDLHHAVVRTLAHKLAQYVKEIEQFEQENSGDIRNYSTDKEDQQE